MNVRFRSLPRRGPIHDAIWVPLKFYHDSRGWLVELFRNRPHRSEVSPGDGVCVPDEARRRPRAARAHRPGGLLLLHRAVHVSRLSLGCPKDSPTFGKKEVRDVGENMPYALIVPAGVVHAYKNVGDKDGLVFNAANRLTRGG